MAKEESDTRQTSARRLVARADDDPVEVRDHALAVLTSADGDLSPDEAITAWALGVALRHLRQLDDARHWLQRAAAHMAPGSDDHTSVVLTLTGAMAFSGELAGAAQLLGELEPSSALAGRVEYQRAAIAEHRGEIAAATDGYRSAIAAFEAQGDQLGEGHASMGLGLVALHEGDAETAAHLFERAEHLYCSLELGTLEATAQHNRGMAATRLGLFDEALQFFEQASAALSALGEPFPEGALEEAELLLLLGRADDAVERVRGVLADIEQTGAGADRAELLVTLGRVLSHAGHVELGRRAFETADLLFERQERPAFRAITRLRQLEFASSGTNRAMEAIEIGAELRSFGLLSESADADVIALSELAIGDERAAECERRLRALEPDDPRHLFADAVGALQRSEYEQVKRATSEAITSVTRRVSTSTSLDVRGAMLALRDRVARIGVSGALAAGRPGDVVEILAAEQSALLRREQPQLPLAQSPSGSRLIVLYDDGRRLVAVDMAIDGPRFVETPDRDDAIGLLRRHSLLLAESLRSPPGVGRSVERSAVEARRLMPWLASGRPIALAVNGELFDAPWASVAAGPLRVVAHLGAHGEVSPAATALVGPGLQSSEAEVESLRSCYGESLTVARDTDPIAAIESAASSTLHIASHGHHDPVRPLASSYSLAQGELDAGRIASLQSAPSIVVAAACRAGVATAVGSQAVGLPLVWLALGASSVIGSTHPLPDDERTVRVMEMFHRQLLAGDTPEQALYHAREADEWVARSLVVVGRLPPGSANTGVADSSID